VTHVQPTQFAELNDVLAELTERVTAILGDDLVGVYLQGSFAVGDADLASDCDFLIPVRSQVTSEQEHCLRALHDELPTRDGFWNRHLEGSYPLAAELKTLDGLGRDWLYIDHGWREMQWAPHCNNVVSRWSLREHGVALAGPAPATLVDPVPPEAMRAYARSSAATFWDDFHTWMSLDVAWGQRYAVTTYCRFLATLATAEVLSKKAALRWGQQQLDPRWQALLQQVMDDRAPYDADEPARPGSVEQTTRFARYCEELSAQALTEREVSAADGTVTR